MGSLTDSGVALLYRQRIVLRCALWRTNPYSCHGISVAYKCNSGGPQQEAGLKASGPISRTKESFRSNNTSQNKICDDSSGETGVVHPTQQFVQAESDVPFKPPTSATIPFFAKGRQMPGQRILPCAPEDIEILSSSKLKFPSPQECEGSIIVRVINEGDINRVTSPVLRVVRNRQFGIREGERWMLLATGVLFSSVLASLGMWQLRRMREKRELIEWRKVQLRKPAVEVVSSPFPWTLEAQSITRFRMASLQKETLGKAIEAAEVVRSTKLSNLSAAQRSAVINPSLSDIDAAISSCTTTQFSQLSKSNSGVLDLTTAADVNEAINRWSYRTVMLHGVLDSRTELFIGPRPGPNEGISGFNVVSPLRLRDGSVVLVNKGVLPRQYVKLPAYEEGQQPGAVKGGYRQDKREKERSDSGLQFHGRGTSPESLKYSIGSHRNETPMAVTVLGVLEPGEVSGASVKAMMLKNKPSEGEFITVDPRDLTAATPGITNRDECGLLMVNAYRIVPDRKEVVEVTDTAGLETMLFADSSLHGVGLNKPFSLYDQKRKEDYLLFYADEHTHFNYACQWFFMSFCTVAMTVYKLIEVSKWRW